MTLASLLSLLVFCSGWWFFRQGYLLYYGDAQAHLNNSRSIFDARMPGYDQLGTVWLPVLHVICLPFVQNMELWTTGLAGTIPVAICFIAAGVFLYLAARDTYQSAAAGAVVVACFACNPNVLYLSVIPMTEVVFLAGLAALLYCEVRFASTNYPGWVAAGVAASWWMSLTRYDGWFLIPFAALWFGYSARKYRLAYPAIFVALAGLAPLYWIAHSWWETGNLLDFFNGPYSAKAIQGGRPYPGFGDWRDSFHYYAAAAQLCSGWGLLLIAALGICVINNTRQLRPITFLLLPCAFYVWSIHSSGNPIHVPNLYPFTYYNTRYGLAFVLVASFAAGALAESLRAYGVFTYRNRLALAIPVVAIAPWLLFPSQEHWICWKESQENSQARRAWTKAGSAFMETNYNSGQGVLAPFGDVAGIFCRSRTSLAEVLHEGGGPAWLATVKRPDLLHAERWAIAQQGDVLDRSLAQPSGNVYAMFQQIEVKGAPTLNIYKRKD